jgi:hypothetical protein
LDVAENSVGSIPSAISTISMPDSHVLPSLQAQAASTVDAAIGCQDENDAADQRQEIEESLGKEVSRAGIEPTTADEEPGKNDFWGKMRAGVGIRLERHGLPLAERVERLTRRLMEEVLLARLVGHEAEALFRNDTLDGAFG